jgi:cyclic dehypoxanthinyl futalosine synthase
MAAAWIAPRRLGLYRHAPTAPARSSRRSLRARKHPDRIVTYIIDATSTTRTSASRAATSARSTSGGSRGGYVLGFEEIFRKIDETIAVGGNQLLLQGGHNPDLPIAWYEDLFGP